jgi:hypothetical protein
MTTGVLIFAFNNEHIDYLAMANWSAKNIRRHLNLPVAVVTDLTVPNNYKFEQIIYAKAEGIHSRKFADQEENVTWYNGNRVDAYNLSPWAQTLLLDADYVVASSELKKILDIKKNFVAHKTAYDIVDQDNFDELNNFGSFNMPMWWATVIMFRRSTEAQMIFESMAMIKNHWKHYRNLYKILNSTYRNDFALSIALGIVNGHTLDYTEIPWSLASLTSEHKLTQIAEDQYRIDFLTQDSKPRYITINQDFHAMGKKHLGDIIANSS